MSAPGHIPLGLLGGTFDPVHFAHLRLAEEAREALGLGEVRWIPAGVPPHRDTPQATPAQRLEMVRLAIAGHPAFSVDATEALTEDPGYTVTTLERLRAALPQRPLVLLMGADAFLGLPGWHRWRELFDLAHLGVATRPGFSWPADSAGWPRELARVCAGRLRTNTASLQETPAGSLIGFTLTPLEISASLLRARLAAGASVRYLLPEAVREYIQQHHLYRPTDGR